MHEVTFAELIAGLAESRAWTVRALGSALGRHVAVLDPHDEDTLGSGLVVMTSPRGEGKWHDEFQDHDSDTVTGADGIERYRLQTADGAPVLHPVHEGSGPTYLRDTPLEPIPMPLPVGK